MRVLQPGGAPPGWLLDDPAADAERTPDGSHAAHVAATVKRTPLKRTGGPKRKTPLKRGRGRSTPRAERPPHQRCSVLRCGAAVELYLGDGEQYCAKHATQKADAEARAWVKARDPVCVARADGRRAHTDADEGVQWAHVYTRGMTYIRWDADNAVGLCARCHYAYTKNPGNWVRFMERTYPGRMQLVLRREIYGERLGGHVPLREVIETYRRGEPWHMADPPPGYFPDD